MTNYQEGAIAGICSTIAAGGWNGINLARAIAACQSTLAGPITPEMERWIERCLEKEKAKIHPKPPPKLPDWRLRQPGF